MFIKLINKVTEPISVVSEGIKEGFARCKESITRYAKWWSWIKKRSTINYKEVFTSFLLSLLSFWKNLCCFSIDFM